MPALFTGSATVEDHRPGQRQQHLVKTTPPANGHGSFLRAPLLVPPSPAFSPALVTLLSPALLPALVTVLSLFFSRHSLFLSSSLLFLNPLACIDEHLHPWGGIVMASLFRVPGALPGEEASFRVWHYSQVPAISRAECSCIIC